MAPVFRLIRFLIGLKQNITSSRAKPEAARAMRFFPARRIVMPFRHASLSEELPITSRLQTLPTFVRVDVVPLLVQTRFSAIRYLSLDF